MPNLTLIFYYYYLKLCFLLLILLLFFPSACLPLPWTTYYLRVADEAFYKQPFADMIGYVYVA